MENKFEFVRFKDKITNEESQKWWFVAKDELQVRKHFEKYFKPSMQEGFDCVAHDAIDAVFKYKGLMMHPTNDVANVLECLARIKGYDPKQILAVFDIGNDILLETLSNRINEIHSGKYVYVEEGVREFGYNDGNPHYEIVERYFSDKLEYPDFKKPTLDEVRYIQWDGGTHWYAKIDKVDVVDEFGNQKWNTKSSAENAAKWFIKNYY
jgi:hypothetical protein